VYVLAQLNPPRQSQTGGLENPMRIVRAARDTYLSPGDVIIGQAGRRHLLLDNGEDELDESDMKSFKSIELNMEYPHSRDGFVTDSITGRSMPQNAALPNIWVSENPLRPLEDRVRIPFGRADLISGTEVLKGDLIGPYVVEDVDERLGVYQIRVQDR
jgi:hypothetical protein